MDGKQLKYQREGRGWTQADLARSVGVTRSAINYIEAGKRGASPQLAKRIREALGIFDRDTLLDSPSDSLMIGTLKGDAAQNCLHVLFEILENRSITEMQQALLAASNELERSDLEKRAIEQKVRLLSQYGSYKKYGVHTVPADLSLIDIERMTQRLIRRTYGTDFTLRDLPILLHKVIGSISDIFIRTPEQCPFLDIEPPAAYAVDGYDGGIILVPKKFLSSKSAWERNRARPRTAHELGHLFLHNLKYRFVHTDSGNIHIEDIDNRGSTARRDDNLVELQAKRWAHALLMPAYLLDRALCDWLGKVIPHYTHDTMKRDQTALAWSKEEHNWPDGRRCTLAELFQVSSSRMALRLVETGAVASLHDPVQAPVYRHPDLDPDTSKR